MGIPIDTRQEIATSSIGNEQKPKDVIVKGSLWTIAQSSGRLILKEFGGSLYRLAAIPVPTQFLATPAKRTDGTLYTDRFWLWTLYGSTGTPPNTVKLYEIEPFSDAYPVIHQSTILLNDVAQVDFSVQSGLNRGIKNTALDITGNNLYVSVIKNPFDDPEIITQKITWPGTRLQKVAALSEGTHQIYDVNLNVASPPNVELEAFDFLPVENLDSAIIVQPNHVGLTWDPKIGASYYTLQRATAIDFSDAVNVYSGPDPDCIDIVLSPGTVYYRVYASLSPGVDSDYSNIVFEDIIFSTYINVLWWNGV